MHALTSESDLVVIDKNPSLPVEPLFAQHIWSVIEELILERKKADALRKAGLKLCSKVLFKGPPGVGKTLAAKYVARAMKLPLVTMDLSTVVSSYLGDTAKNVRRIFEIGEKSPCVVFLDEIDAIAVSRKDSNLHDEMRRVVNALLQRMDAFSGKSLMLAATNTAEILDAACLRRFDHQVSFPMPDFEARENLIRVRLKPHGLEELASDLAVTFENESYAAIDTLLDRAMRRKVITDCPLNECVERVVRDYVAN